jgi:hypothetical protein
MPRRKAERAAATPEQRPEPAPTGPVPAIDPKKLYTIADGLFSMETGLLQLTHAALALCSSPGKSQFSTKQITDGINQLFKPSESGAVDGFEEARDYNVKRLILRSTDHPYDRTLIPRLGAYILCECFRDPTLLEKPSMVEARSLSDFFETAKSKLNISQQRNEDVNQRQRADHQFDKVIGGLRHLTEKPQATEGKIYLDFFQRETYPNDDLTTYPDVCYLLSYRYALTKGMMIRTFLSMSTPAFNKRGVFEYHHVHVDGPTIRRARGVLIKLGGSYYFLGSSARRHQQIFPIYPEGIQIIAIEEEQFAHDASGGLRAVYVTNDNRMRPMIGRTAIIPLGRRSSIGRQSYINFALGRFKASELDSQVATDLSKVRNYPTDPDEVANFIRQTINFGDPDMNELLGILRSPINVRDQNPD